MENNTGGNIADMVARLTQRAKGIWRKDRLIKLYPLFILLAVSSEPKKGLIEFIITILPLAAGMELMVLGLFYLILLGLNALLIPYRTSAKPVYKQAASRNADFFDQNHMNTVMGGPGNIPEAGLKQQTKEEV